MLHLKHPLHNTETRQHQGNLDVASDVVLSCCCCPFPGADRRALEISWRISGQIFEKIPETSFQISAFFFGSFVQQKGDAKKKGLENRKKNKMATPSVSPLKHPMRFQRMIFVKSHDQWFSRAFLKAAPHAATVLYATVAQIWSSVNKEGDVALE